MSCAYGKLPSFSAQQLPLFFEAMPAPFLCITQDLKIAFYNKALAALLHLDTRTGTVQSMQDIMPALQPNGLCSQKHMHNTLHLAQSKGSYFTTFLLQKNDTDLITTQVTFTPLQEGENEYFACYIAPFDTCDSCFYEASKTRELTRSILDTLPIVMHIWSKDLKLIDCSHAVAQHFKVESKEEYKKNYQKFSPEYQPDGRSDELFVQYLHEAFEKGVCKFQWMGLDSTGKIIPTEETLCHVLFEGEECVLGYTQDISAITENILGINQMEERTRAILDKTPMAIHIWDKELRLRDCNLENLRIFGFQDKADFLEDPWQTFPELQPDGTRSSKLIDVGLEAAFETGFHHYETIYGLSSTGESIPLEMTFIRLVLRDEDMIIGYLRDLREVTKVLKAIKASEERVQNILDISPLGINVWGEGRHLLDCNDRIIRLFGYESREEYMQNPNRAYPLYQPDGQNSLQFAEKLVAQAFAEGFAPPQEFLLLDKDGNDLPVEINLTRVKTLDGFVVISFIRDLREFKAMLAEIHAVEQDLRTARDAAEQSAQAKSDFLANMSHEIRTPLNGVLGLLHLMDNTQLDALQKDYVGKTIFSASNLLRIINDILDFSKIDAGKMEMENIPFTLYEIASELKLLFKPQVQEKGLQLLFVGDDYAKRFLLGDPLRIKQIFFNLIGNAIKFTERGSITISLEVQEEKSAQSIRCLFSVTDTGIGMTQEQCSRLFSAFMQADTSVTRKYGGTGLGLVIAKRMANLMHGDLWVESSQGVGSTFFFTAIFEYASEKEIATAPTANDVTITQQDLENIASYTTAEALTQPSSSHTEATTTCAVETAEKKEHAHTAHILLVEDNPINQLIAEELLKSVGHSVDIANNGQEALQLLTQNTYNLVLMDIQMPILDGLTTVKKIRQDKQLQHMPVVAMSAHAMTGDKEKSLEHGMNDHITKPICPETLFATVQKWAQFSS